MADNLNDLNYQKECEYDTYPVGKWSLLCLCISVTAQPNHFQQKHRVMEHSCGVSVFAVWLCLSIRQLEHLLEGVQTVGIHSDFLDALVSP